MDLNTSMIVAASGMRAQSKRMRIIAENIANANSTSQTPGGDPYRRKVATVKSDFDRELNATLREARQADRRHDRFQHAVRSRQSGGRQQGLRQAAQRHPR